MSEKQACNAASHRGEEDVRMPRRSFIHNAVVGVAGAPLLLAGAGGAPAGGGESGQITLDALLLTYFSAPLGALSSSSWTVTESYSTSFRLKALADTTLTLKASVPEGEERFGDPAFKQSRSTQVNRGITLRRGFVRGEVENTLTPAPGIPDNTMLYGLLRPRLQLDGTAKRLRFRFLKTEAIFLFGLAGIQSDDPVIKGVFSRDTVHSFVSQYVTDPALLIGPRFELRATILLPAGVKDVFAFTESGGCAFSETKTAVTTATIMEQTGFRSDSAKQALAVGNPIAITYAPVQEFDSDEIIRVETSLERPAPGVNKVYWDRVFKTFVIIDAGLAPSSGQVIVQGKVTDGAGLAIPGALVKLRQLGIDYATLADNSGGYLIATPPGEPLATGMWPIRCGNVVQHVSIHSGMTSVNFSGVVPEFARQRSFDRATSGE
ncbi:MAG TPA: carboxypeptidase-like regulatory domain-containing protein [Blastocatellia bacterium]|nr:carboxypeptidase-like regulatory domain-containing protein [Blastocatellia bacterium]